MATARLEARISTEQKAHFAAAAALEGQTLTRFVVEAVQAAADEALERHTTIRLSEAATVQFLEALANPIGPNDYLRAAAADYHEAMKSVDRR